MAVRTSVSGARSLRRVWVALAIAAAACTELEDLEGTYVLVSIDGIAPPVIVPKETDLGVGLRTIVVADTLRFVPGGVGEWIHVAYREPIAGGPPSDASWVDCLRYERNGQTLHLTFSPCGRGAIWYGDDAVLASPDTLVRAYFGSWRYVRLVPPPPQ